MSWDQFETFQRFSFDNWIRQIEERFVGAVIYWVIISLNKIYDIMCSFHLHFEASKASSNTREKKNFDRFSSCLISWKSKNRILEGFLIF